MDSGMFMDARDRFDTYYFRQNAQSLVETHMLSNPDCTRAYAESQKWVCFFPPYALREITTPLFIFHAYFDYIAIMIGNQLPYNATYAGPCLNELMFKPGVLEAIRTKTWDTLVWSSTKCTPGEREALLSLAYKLYSTLSTLVKRKNNMSIFLHKSITHCAWFNGLWLAFSIQGTSLRDEFTGWLRKPKDDTFVYASSVKV
eukprot:TRINITY_DN5051_c0_g2_i1.p1 TRINITY_DN5051_c0_g2~~TRINITY_DN5051_c0_g2_i1.p1  ORF type:complete len:231 (+),score=7.55 TRINITY_DN5051_c0_g2_i1:91-693(+)